MTRVVEIHRDGTPIAVTVEIERRELHGFADWDALSDESGEADGREVLLTETERAAAERAAMRSFRHA